jgi:hypothetical protein
MGPVFAGKSFAYGRLMGSLITIFLRATGIFTYIGC